MPIKEQTLLNQIYSLTGMAVKSPPEPPCVFYFETVLGQTDPAQDVQPAESHAVGVRLVAVVTDKRLFIALPAAVVLA